MYCFHNACFRNAVVSNDSVSGQCRPRSDWADVQADLGRHSPHMPKDTFLLWPGPFYQYSSTWK